MFSMITNENDDFPAAIIEAGGVLDRHSYLSLINMIKELHKRGHQNLVIDLKNLQINGLTGFFALYSGAMVFNGDKPLEPAGGLKSLRAMADKVSDYRTHHLKVLVHESNAKRVLCKSGIPIYDDLESALASFGAR